MAFHGFPGGPCRLHLLFHEQMKILPEAAEEVKTDLIRRTACGSYADVYDTMDSSGLTENLENHI